MVEGRNKNGLRLQDQIAGLLGASGVSFMSQYRTSCRPLYKGRFLRVDFLLHDVPQLGEVYVSCKVQDTGGSAHEKVAHEIQTIRDCLDLPTVLVLSGEELSEARKFAASYVGSNLLGVFDLDGFARWLRNIGCESRAMKAFNAQQKTIW